MTFLILKFVFWKQVIQAVLNHEYETGFRGIMEKQPLEIMRNLEFPFGCLNSIS